MAVDPKVEEALALERPLEQLRELAKTMQRAGQEPDVILGFFDKNRQALREAGRESDEDIVLEIMDFLVGWCSPHVSLAPKQP